jgi:hypothetical protein
MSAHIGIGISSVQIYGTLKDNRTAISYSYRIKFYLCALCYVPGAANNGH